MRPSASDAARTSYRFREAPGLVGRCIPSDGRGRYDRPMSRSEHNILECAIKRVHHGRGLGVKRSHCEHAEPASPTPPKLAR
jgi:hypothetical protein